MSSLWRITYSRDSQCFDLPMRSIRRSTISQKNAKFIRRRLMLEMHRMQRCAWLQDSWGAEFRAPGTRCQLGKSVLGGRYQHARGWSDSHGESCTTCRIRQGGREPAVGVGSNERIRTQRTFASPERVLASFSCCPGGRGWWIEQIPAQEGQVAMRG